MTRPALLVSVVAAGLAVTAVAGGQAQAPAQAGGDVTFSEHVAPIIFNNCSSCHRPGEAGPFPLLSYADVRPRGRQIATVVRQKQMPPWKPESDFHLKGERGLTEQQISTLERWVAAGMPQGDPAKLPALPPTASGWALGEPDLIVKMPEAFPVPPSGRDVYRTFVLPLNLKEDVWVKAVDFRPGSRPVVHHVLFYADSTGTARQRDAQDALPGFAGGMGGGLVGGGALAALAGRGGRGGAQANAAAARPAATVSIGGWVPGSQPRMLPDDLAYLVPAGSDLILATHFHPNGQEEEEASTVGLYFAERRPSKGFTGIHLPPTFGLLAGINIPPNVPDYTISDSFVLPIDVRAFGIVGHAHYIAKTMLMTATLPGGEKKTILSIRDWDFGWQEQYQFGEFIDFPKGTKIDVTITYDNTASNKRNPSNPPRRVTWGEQSTDEMGSMIMSVVAKNAGELPILQQALAAHTQQKVQQAQAAGGLFGARGRGGR
jgi:mono/diheme cytochrome c family protein